MDLKGFLKNTFGKDLFTHLKDSELMAERIKTEKRIEQISNEIKSIQMKIQRLMMESKGQPEALKMLNIQKIKALRLESDTKQRQASGLLREMQLLLLLQAMKEHQKDSRESEFIERVLNSDVEELGQTLFDTDVQEAIREGRMDEVKDKLKSIFAKSESPMDSESHEILSAINELEKVDEETALRMAGERAKGMLESYPPRKKIVLKKEEEEDEEEGGEY
jgi:hypothetical protein